MIQKLAITVGCVFGLGSEPLPLFVCPPARLLLVHLDDVVLLHLQGLRGLVIVDPPSVEQEPAQRET